jgi:ABC-type phosphate/phosphonate transport system, ATPase component
MLLLDQVGKTYPNGVNALERFTAAIKPGEIVAVIGGSGCGKSTLLRPLPGSTVPVVARSRLTATSSPRRIRRSASSFRSRACCRG